MNEFYKKEKKKGRFGLFLVILIVVGLLYFWITKQESRAPTEPDEVNFNLQDRGSSESYIRPQQATDNEKDTTETILDTLLENNEKDIAEETVQGYLNEDDAINIRVYEPEENTVLISPFTIFGDARVFEGTVNIRITNASQDVLIEETANVHAQEVGEYGSFKITIFYEFSSTKEGFVEVYSISPKDGSEENKVSIPVTFK